MDLSKIDPAQLQSIISATLKSAHLITDLTPTKLDDTVLAGCEALVASPLFILAMQAIVNVLSRNAAANAVVEPAALQAQFVREVHSLASAA